MVCYSCVLWSGNSMWCVIVVCCGSGNSMWCVIVVCCGSGNSMWCVTQLGRLNSITVIVSHCDTIQG